MNQHSEEISASKKTWFISDLHLDESRPHLFKLFHDFIDSIHGQAETLYILGDLFEFWIGDDIIDAPAGKPYLPIIERLKALSDSGTKIFFVQGNRDFLIQKAFMQRIGGELLPDHKVIDLYGLPTLIMHGDTLCTDDKAYQRLRRILRMKIVQKIYSMLSPESRAKKAGGVREVTSKKTQQKSYEILDVNQQSVEEVMQQEGVFQLIHGHTHRPDTHQFELGGQEARRIVLGAWHDKASFLECSPEGMRLYTGSE